MDVAALAREIAADRAAGRLPFLVVGTAGATSSGVIDPLPALADLCVAEKLWFHADAAWGGGALLSPRLRMHLAGIERADSVTWDAHKWLQVPLGSGMFFTRHPEAPLAAFATASAYMPAARAADGTSRVDPYNVSHQWSRRAPGIALFAALAELGEEGWARLVEHMAEMGDAMRSKLRAAGFEVVHATPLPLGCFTHPRIESGAVTTGDVARAVHRRARAWISPSELADGQRVLRACVTSFRTEERDLDVLVEEVVAAVG
jgi:glutamate/tyrosine decarboxylase-like PLP-dependent enzyme